MRPCLLVVDDEDSIRLALERWFQLRGFQVDCARDGVEAVEMCQHQHYDVITLDLDMPRLDGLSALPLIRDAQPKTPVVVVTGLVREAEEASSAGVSLVLTKPLRLSQLEEEIRCLLPATEH